MSRNLPFPRPAWPNPPETTMRAVSVGFSAGMENIIAQPDVQFRTISGISSSSSVSYSPLSSPHVIEESLDESYSATIADALTFFIDLSTIHVELKEIRENVMQIKEMLDVLMDAPQTFVVPLSTLSHESYEIIRPISVVVEPVIPDDPEEDCEYVASFVEGSVGAQGSTAEEAIQLLKEQLVNRLNLLESLPKLGNRLQRQLDVLHSVIRECQNEAKTK